MCIRDRRCAGKCVYRRQLFHTCDQLTIRFAPSGVDPEALCAACREGNAHIAGQTGDCITGQSQSLAAIHMVHCGRPVHTIHRKVDGITTVSYTHL